MKRNKVLLGLFVGVFAIAGGVATAQSTAGTKFYEMGPSNVSGAISSIVVDQRDASRTTLFAGAATGGLFIKSEDTTILHTLYAAQGGNTAAAQNTEIWHNVVYTNADNQVDVLPVSSLAQGEDNTLYIGTGDNSLQLGSHYSAMSVLGKGLFRYLPQTSEFRLVPGTAPATLDAPFAAIHDVAVGTDGGKTYLYVASNSGLYRWVVSSESQWASASYEKLLGEEVFQIEVAPLRNMIYFATANQVYRISNMFAEHVNMFCITEGNSKFGGHNKAIKLAIAPTDNTYIYAMVVNSNGRMNGLYVTTNDQDWLEASTGSVAPLTYNSGEQCGAVLVDPTNPKRLYIGGTNIYVGQSYVENQAYMWIPSASSEKEIMLYSTNYMASVFNSSTFVHSGIHQMVSVRQSDGSYIYYIATDGGVFTTTDFMVYSNVNRGLNTVQINSLAVSPDGTLVSGANANACPVIEPRMAHYGGDIENTWYDDGSLGNINHDANLIFSGSGSQVAASSFQQLSPQPRRNIFVSNESLMGRSYADYLDYSNTQTWTTGSDFMAETYEGGPAMKQLYLWESLNDKYFKDTLHVALDTLGYVLDANGDSLQVTGADFPILAGYTGTFQSRAHADYPFQYTFKAEDMMVDYYVSHRDTIKRTDEPDTVVTVIDTLQRQRTAKDSIYVKNPIQARMVTVGELSSTQTGVFYSWRATDFTKVFAVTNPLVYEKIMRWPCIYKINRGLSNSPERHYFPRTVAISNDGRFVFVAVVDTLNKSSVLLRISNFEKVNFTTSEDKSHEDLLDVQASDYVLHIDTLKYDGTNVWMPRIISSIAIDQRNGKDNMILTFEGYDDQFANVAVVSNLGGTMALKQVALGQSNIPAFCSMVDVVNGDVYVGTTDGVYMQGESVFNGSTAWRAYTKLPRVPVTSMCQQTHDYPVMRLTTHEGINKVKYVYSRSKWPYAMYFGTYGRGIFMDMSLVTDTVNEASDPQDYNGIPTVNNTGFNSISVYPNPVEGMANISVVAGEAGRATMYVYDLNGRCVMTRNMGQVEEGEHAYTLDCSGLSNGMYLINVIIGGHTAAAKMMVR